MALTSSFVVRQNSLSLRCHGFNYASPKKLFSILLFKPKSSLATQNCNPRCSGGEHSVTRRMLNLTIAAMSMCGLLNSFTPLLVEEIELERYTDSKEGFTLLKPSSWTKVDRAGATVLFQEANKEVTILGLWKTRFALKVLKSLEILNLWLISLYKQKNVRKAHKKQRLLNLQRGHEKEACQFEYVVDSSRGGMKRIFSAAFVASKKLYLLDIVHSDKPESPLDSHKRMILEQVFHSFDAATLV